MSRASIFFLFLFSAAPVIGCHARPHDVDPPDAPIGVDEEAVDPSVSPCDDFYEYACGGWIQATPIPADEPSWRRGFDIIEAQNERRLRKILENAARSPSADLPYAKELGDYYAACMDESAVERAGLAPLAPELARIDAVNDAQSLAREVAHLHLAGVAALFDVGSGQDYKDATQMIATVEQGGLGMPDRDYYLNDDAQTKKTRSAYQAHLARLLVLVGEEPDKAAADASTVIRIELALAKASMSNVDRRNPYVSYHRIDRAGLERVAPGFSWDAYFAELGFPGITAINVGQPEFMAVVSRLVHAESPRPAVGPAAHGADPETPPTETRAPPLEMPLHDLPIGVFRSYLRAHVVAAAAPFLSHAFVDEDFTWKRVLTGAEELLPRWKRCVRRTGAAMGQALGRPFALETLGAGGKARVESMIRSIEASMGGDLEHLAWMDASTRARAIEKLAMIANQVGYPDVWRSYKGLAIDRTSYLANALRANVFELHRQLTKIGKPVDRTAWQMSPSAVNAYYDLSMNEMVFPAGILQPPFYVNGGPAAENLGGIGMVMGHELTHGFDDEGRQFDGRGDLVDWWTKRSAREFERRAECVARQYEGYVPVDSLHIDGRLTLGENLADLGGVKLAYESLERELATHRHTTAGRFTPEQRFFIGYAQAWCTAERPEHLRLLVMTNPHSPAHFRVVGPLSNLPEFADAFQCRAGSRMVRSASERCEVW